MLRKVTGAAAALCVTLAVGLAGRPAAYADPGCGPGCAAGCSAGCGFDCQRHHCPPRYHHCQEGPPRLKFRKGCPRPVCGPCELDHYGYYEPCWRAWPFPPDWTHCPVPPAPVQFAATAGVLPLPPGAEPPAAGRFGPGPGPGVRTDREPPVDPDRRLPPPRKLDKDGL